MLPIVVLSGPVSAGKTELATGLCERFAAKRFSTRSLLEEQRKRRGPRSRAALQRLGERLDRQTGGRWVAEALSPEIAALRGRQLVIVDSVRILQQVEGLRHAFGRRVVHVHVTASPAELERRYRRRSKASPSGELPTYDDVRRNATERSVGTLADDADIVIDSERCTPADVLVRAASHLGLDGRGGARLVDVVLGGQYGSEGKGNIAYHLAPEYDALVRVGGPNAGHKVYGPTGVIMTHHQLPSGTLAAPEAKLVIGAGAVLNVEKLLDEIARCNVDVERLIIDPQAMLISGADIRAERQKGGLVQKISSTGQGVGAATARRVRQRHGTVRLAKDERALGPYLASSVDYFESVYASGRRILLEGTQGTGLSLFHGAYPYVTSRDTTASGTLGEAGIPPGRVSKVVMTCRTYPIRVGNPKGGTSGPMAQPTSWAGVARRSGLDVRRLRKAERTSTTNRPRRVSEFDWELLRRASLLNEPTDIALTFVDYIDRKNEEARRFDQLTRKTLQFIEEVERIARAPVSLVSTRFHPRCIIDRRRW